MKSVNSDVLCSALHDLGLSEAEVAVYQSSLFLGAKPASIIARSSGINRAHIYRVLESLKERGLIEEHTKNNVKYFSAISPEGVLERLDSLVTNISERRKTLETVLPELDKLRNRSSGQPVIRFLQGSIGLEKALEDTLSIPASEIVVFTDITTGVLFGTHISHRWMKRYNTQRLRRQIGIRVLIGCADANFVPHESKVLKQELRAAPGISFPADLFVYGDRIAILSSKSERRGVILENRMMADTFRTVHKMLWHSVYEQPAEKDVA